MDYELQKFSTTNLVYCTILLFGIIGWAYGCTYHDVVHVVFFYTWNLRMMVIFIVMSLAIEWNYIGKLLAPSWQFFNRRPVKHRRRAKGRRRRKGKGIKSSTSLIKTVGITYQDEKRPEYHTDGSMVDVSPTTISVDDCRRCKGKGGKTTTSLTSTVGFTYQGGERPVYRKDVTTAEVSSTVMLIDEYVFGSWISLEYIIIPPSVTTIGQGAFAGCRSLKYITIPPSVTTIGIGAFELCASLTSVVLPSSITTLQQSVFYNCNSLTSVVLPSTITTLNSHMFMNCSSLTSITIPSTVTKVDDCVFKNCSSLKSVILPPNITSVGHSVFKSCSSLTSVTLPSTITSFGNKVFKGCSSLTSVTVPPTTIIGHNFFQNCSSLTSVNLPENFTAISITAFNGCSKLTTIKSSYFSTTTFDNNLKNILIDAGFSPQNPNDITCGQSKFQNMIRQSRSQPQQKNTKMYYHWKTWAKTSGLDGRLPLVTAAARSMKWSYMRQIFTDNMPVICELDALTGLPLFMLAATGPNSDIESIYNLLKNCPHAISIVNIRHPHSSTDSINRKKGGG